METTGYGHFPNVETLEELRAHLETVTARDETHARELQEDIEALTAEIASRREDVLTFTDSHGSTSRPVQRRAATAAVLRQLVSLEDVPLEEREAIASHIAGMRYGYAARELQRHGVALSLNGERVSPDVPLTHASWGARNVCDNSHGGRKVSLTHGGEALVTCGLCSAVLVEAFPSLSRNLERLHVEESPAHREQWEAIARGLEVSLVAFDPARDAYVYNIRPL